MLLIVVIFSMRAYLQKENQSVGTMLHCLAVSKRGFLLVVANQRNMTYIIIFVTGSTCWINWKQFLVLCTSGILVYVQLKWLKILMIRQDLRLFLKYITSGINVFQIYLGFSEGTPTLWCHSSRNFWIF